MDTWIQDNLSGILNFEVPPEMISLIHQMSKEQDLKEYMMTLLDATNPEHLKFYKEMIKKRAQSKGSVGYRKTQDNDQDKSKPKDNKKKNKGKKNKEKEKEVATIQPGKIEKPVSKKQNFVNLYSDDGKDRTILLKGRNKCDCEAKVHKLINNCLNCGRIVCEQEGSGPCFFCNELVCTRKEYQIITGNSKKSDNLYNKLMEQKPNKNENAALKQRDKLLEYDRESTKRTRVIDGECDYYKLSTNSWISKQEREQAMKRDEKSHELKHASRLTQKVTLDLYGRTIIDDPENIEEILNQQFPQVENNKNHGNNSAELICPSFEFEQPQYIAGTMARHILSKPSQSSGIHRVQDKELLEMVDEGYCISMHQPYASLLVAGIKIHEGRTWYSAHRGRLWIHAASKVPSTEEISSLEHRYKVMQGNDHLKFPQAYEVGCLQGFVTLVDVLSQEEYRKKYPNGESDSPYVFICDDFHELPLKFAMQGKHKIYKLEKRIHQAALKVLKQFIK